MKKIIITGVLNQPFGSFPVATQSDDGVSWDALSSPFGVNTAPTAIANDSSNIAISNGNGYLAVSNDDLQTFSNITVSDGFSINSMAYADGDWIAVGEAYYKNAYGPYDPRSDIAQIHKASSAYGPWSMIWIHPNTDSFFYQIRKFVNAQVTDILAINVWVVVGSVGENGDAWYSIDDGATWTQIPVPQGVGRIYSVDFASIGAENFWYWGSRNNLYKSSTLDTSDWSEVSVPTDTVIKDIVSNDENIVAAGTRWLNSSQDGNYFNSQFLTGYVFDRTALYQNDQTTVYLAFMRSSLTQYTYLRSTNGLNWDFHNNNVCVSGYTVKL